MKSYLIHCGIERPLKVTVSGRKGYYTVKVKKNTWKESKNYEEYKPFLEYEDVRDVFVGIDKNEDSEYTWEGNTVILRLFINGEDEYIFIGNPMYKFGLIGDKDEKILNYYSNVGLSNELSWPVLETTTHIYFMSSGLCSPRSAFPKDFDDWANANTLFGHPRLGIPRRIKGKGKKFTGEVIYDMYEDETHG